MGRRGRKEGKGKREKGATYRRGCWIKGEGERKGGGKRREKRREKRNKEGKVNSKSPMKREMEHQGEEKKGKGGKREYELLRW